MEDEDFLAAVEADNANAPADLDDEPAPASPEPPPPAAEPPAPADAAPAEPAPEPAPEPAAPPPPPETSLAPVAALVDERIRRQKAEEEAAQLRAQLQAQQQPAEIPDPDLDPAGYAQYQESRIQNVLLNQTLNTSERFARKEHGAETVEAAKQWAQQRFQTDPLYQAQILRDADPYERVVLDYKRDQLFSKISDPSDYDQFLAWKAAQGQVQGQQGGHPPPPNPSPPIPPRSLASAPSAGDIREAVIQTDDEMFAEVIPKR